MPKTPRYSMDSDGLRVGKERAREREGSGFCARPVRVAAVARLLILEVLCRCRRELRW
jgi:hypothetical protein